MMITIIFVVIISSSIIIAIIVVIIVVVVVVVVVVVFKLIALGKRNASPLNLPSWAPLKPPRTCSHSDSQCMHQPCVLTHTEDILEKDYHWLYVLRWHFHYRVTGNSQRVFLNLSPKCAAAIVVVQSDPQHILMLSPQSVCFAPRQS